MILLLPVLREFFIRDDVLMLIWYVMQIRSWGHEHEHEHEADTDDARGEIYQPCLSDIDIKRRARFLVVHYAHWVRGVSDRVET